MKKSGWIFFLFVAFASFAQQDSTVLNRKLDLIKHVSILLKDSLKLQTGEHFYTEFVNNDSMFSYVYISDKDSVKNVLKDPYEYFGTHYTEAKIAADSFSRYGFDVMHYKTAGTSAALLNKRLLEYDSLSLVFILIHEAMHRHKKNSGAKFPYEYEEALGDVIANSFCGWYSGVSVKDFFAFAYRNEEIYRMINKCSEGKISKKKCGKQIRKHLEGATLFQNDRFNYAVNNAYLLGYSSYAKHYFELRELYQRMKDPKLFIDEMMKLPADVKGCETEIINLKRKY